MAENHLGRLCFLGIWMGPGKGECLLDDECSNTPHLTVTFLRKEVG